MSGPTATFPAGGGGARDPVQRRLLHVFGPAGALGEVALPRSRLVLGRAPGTGGLRLADDTVSQSHAEIAYMPAYDVFRVRDLDSKNGIYVEGRRVPEAVLEDGTVLRVGESLFVMEELRAPAVQGLSPPVHVSLARARAERMVDMAADSDLPVLIRGPTGSGKERLARRVHEGSGRSGELVSLNCATLASELLASELFGHVRGAFSGADGDRAGLISAAEAGTFFLDEIGELPLAQQPALLRVLEEGRLRPVGADRESPVDVRFVAATHVDLVAACAASRFRSDLYARLAGLEVELPGLSKRRVEILPLVAEFAAGARPDVLAAEGLLLHAWPMNVRELLKWCKRLQMMGIERFGAEHLPKGQEPKGQEPKPEAPPAFGAPRPPPTRGELESLLETYRGRVADVARALAVSRQSVYRMMEEFDLSAAEFRRRSRP